MPVGRLCAVALGLCLAAPASAHGGTSGTPARVAGGQTRQPDVVVTGGPEKKGAWKRAESEHVVVFSKGSDAELTRVTRNLERLYFLMSRLYRAGDQSDDTVKLQVTLVDSTKAFRDMDLRNIRSEEGPYKATFSDQRYYDPREDGEVLAVARDDQVIKMDTNLAYNLDCEDRLATGAIDCISPPVPRRAPLVRDWEAVLYSAFAQHFILSYIPAAFPRWYVDGIGALFSTVEVRRDGAVVYARPPADFRNVLRSYGDLDVEAILTGRYLDTASSRASWTPYHAWLLTHFFLFSSLKPERSKQFSQYMRAIHQGTSMAEAAKVFGKMSKLQREINSYITKPVSFTRTEPPQAIGDEPQISTLSLASAALIEARIELGPRVAALPLVAEAAQAADAPIEAQRRADWLAQVRDRAAQLPDDADTLLFAAEAECRSGQHGECLAAADRVLTRAPDNILALTWKGVALTDQGVTGPAAQRPDTLAAARKAIQRAISLDDRAPLPLIAYFQSFAKAGERVPEQAMLGMTKVIRRIPAAPAPRLYLGEELLRQGQTDLARRVLHPVLYGAYDSPEKKVAEALFPLAAGTPSVGH